MNNPIAPHIYQQVLLLALDREAKAKYIPAFRNIFKVDTSDHIGDNWLVADFGADDDGQSYIVTTDRIHASESAEFTNGARADAELVCRLLNDHYRAIAERAQLARWNESETK